MTVSDALLEQLLQRFAGGAPAPATWQPGAYVPDHDLPTVATELHVLPLMLPPWSDAPLIFTDGSVPSGTTFGGAAAAMPDGRVLVAWYTASVPLPAQYAEWQAFRLGLRLAAGQAGYQILTDCREVAEQAHRIPAGREINPDPFGCSDPAATGEIAELLRAAPVTVTYRPDEGTTRTAATTLARRAHALAWGAGGLLRAGLDPITASGWLTHIGTKGWSHQYSLRRSFEATYMRGR